MLSRTVCFSIGDRGGGKSFVSKRECIKFIECYIGQLMN